MLKPQRLSHFFEVYPFFDRNETSKRQKSRKWVVKTIKCIYSELWILILSEVPFDFYLINLFQTVLGQRTTISSLPPTRLSLDAIRVPGSAFYFVSSLAFMVGYLFVNASQGVGDEIVVTQIVLVFIWVSGLFRANFSKPPHRGCPTPKRAKKAELLHVQRSCRGSSFLV